jgi:hypothetical protein
MNKVIFLLLLISTCFFSELQAQKTILQYTDTFNVYSLSYPSDFQIARPNTSITFFVGPLTSADDNYQEKIKIELNSIPDNVTVDSLAPVLLEKMKGSLKGGVAVGVSNEPVELGGQKGRELRVDGIMVGETELVKVAIKVFIVKKILVMILTVEPRMDEVLAWGKKRPIEEIVESIKFKQ